MLFLPKIFFDMKTQETIQIFSLCSQHWTIIWGIFYLNRIWTNVTDNCKIMRPYTSASHISCVHADRSNFYSVPLASSVILRIRKWKTGWWMLKYSHLHVTFSYQRLSVRLRFSNHLSDLSPFICSQPMKI